MQHIMVDLETMGTRPGCAIASIGAVRFDPEKDPDGAGIKSPENRFYRTVDLRTCTRAGLKLEPDTVYWWLSQSPEARGAICKEREPLTVALADFHSFAKRSAFLWGHGASFDQPILEMAFRAAKMDFPFPFWNHRDTRTIYDLAGVRPERDPSTHHNALADAEAQAYAVVKAYRILRK